MKLKYFQYIILKFKKIDKQKTRTFVDVFGTVFVCAEDFGWPVIFGRFGITVGVDGAEVLRSELGFICWFFIWLEKGNTDMMEILVLQISEFLFSNVV